MSPPQIIIADDHPLFREALGLALSKRFGEVQLHEAGSMEELQLVSAQHTDADLVLLDLHMPGVQGFSALIYLRAHHPELPVCVISANHSPTVVDRAMAHGAAAFIHKSAPVDEIHAALSTVLEGGLWQPHEPTAEPKAEEMDVASRISELTPQQFRVLMMLTDGLLNKQIAHEIGISEATVKAHLTAIFRKLGVSNRTQAGLLISRLDVDSSEATSSGF